MPKYKADIFPHGGSISHVAYVESDDQWSAEALLKLQYPNCDVRWLQRVSVQAASTDVARVSYTLIGAALAVVAFAISHVVRLIMSNREQDADKTPAAAPRTA